MKKTLTIMNKDIMDFINSSQYYIISIAFLIITGWVFVYRLFLINQATLKPLFSILPFILMIFIPLITMGTFASEKEKGTIEILLTMPFKDYEIILGKFLAIAAILVLTLISTIIFPITIIALGSPDIGEIFSEYLGTLFVGLSFISLGLFGSTITNNQITGFIISFILSFIFIFINTLSSFFSGILGRIFNYLSINTHYYSMINGVIDTKDVIYFLSFIVFFLFLVKISLESRKW